MADYNQKLATYNNQMKSLIDDQHKIVNSSHVWHIDITWHWDSSINNVVVTNVDITLERDAPVSTANGFWDAMVLINPNNTIPQ